MEAVLEHVHGDVLDFGAGQQKYRSLFAVRARSYTALDIDPQPGIDIVGDVLEPPIPDASYDTVVSNQVMEHVRKPWVMVQQIARILRPGGRCILTAPFTAPFHAHPHDYFRFTEEGMRSLVEDAGLEVILCTKYGGFWAAMGEMVKQRYFSPYRAYSRLRRLLAHPVGGIFRLLDRCTTPGIIYPNILCIARKP